MGHIKMNSKNILTQKRHLPYTISIPYLEFAIFTILTYVLLLIYIEVWSGLGAFWRTSEREEGKVIKIL